MKPTNAPYAWNQPAYRAKIQYAPKPDTTTPLTTLQTMRIQHVIGTFLYYSITVDPTMLVALGTIAAAQAHVTEHTAGIVQLLNYAAMHPDAVIWYHAADMILHIHSDASYLSEPQARSRASGHFFLSSQPVTPGQLPVES
jgi:hypothetical protein